MPEQNRNPTFSKLKEFAAGAGLAWAVYSGGTILIDSAVYVSNEISTSPAYRTLGQTEEQFTAGAKADILKHIPLAIGGIALFAVPHKRRSQ
jgi:hypothetical protein